MNPMMMQMWIVAFEAFLKGTQVNEWVNGEEGGYQAAQFAEAVLKGAQRAAREAAEVSKVVKL